MNFKLIADSCCDMTKTLKKKLGLITIPLRMILGDKEYVDTDDLDVGRFITDMNAYKGKAGSSCPSSADYRDAFLGSGTSFAVTLSQNLSGSYASAMAGKALAEEEGADVHVFDSKSASAGEILVALKIRELIDMGKEKLEIIDRISKFIKEMKTNFVLENVDNLVKNGRMSKIAGHIATIMQIRPLLGSDGDGNIALFSKARGSRQALDKLADTVAESGKNTEGETMVITHCNNPNGAALLKNIIAERYRFAKIHIIPTGGLSSLYANNGGIIMAY